MMFYLNITCGLMLISQEKYILKCLGLSLLYPQFLTPEDVLDFLPQVTNVKTEIQFIR